MVKRKGSTRVKGYLETGKDKTVDLLKYSNTVKKLIWNDVYVLSERK